MTSKVIQTFLSNFKRSGLVNRILLTGGCGSFGRDLYPHLKQIYGAENVLITDIENTTNVPGQYFKHLDVTNKKQIEEVTLAFRPDTLLHFASLTPLKAQNNPSLALQINAEGSRYVIEAATQQTLRILSTSSVATFGSQSLLRNAPDVAVQKPETMQGITKFYLEMIGNYHRKRHGTDFRALRYPLIVSPTLLPDKISTDIIGMFYAAYGEKKYKCHLRPDRLIPIIYVEDAIMSLLQLLEAPKEKLLENTFNVSSCSYTPRSQALAIQKQVPGFEVKFKEDETTTLFDSWAETLDDSQARDQWGFDPQFGLEEITTSMLELAQRDSSSYQALTEQAEEEKSDKKKKKKEKKEEKPTELSRSSDPIGVAV